MKTKLLLFILLFTGAASVVRAQYYPLVDTGRVWTSTMCGFGPSGMLCTTHYFKLEDDTIIGLHAYKGVWMSSDSGLVNPNWYLQGFMREDAAKKVYYVNYNDTQEYRYYDFDITVGDTAHLENFGGPVDMIVDSVSTALINNQARNVYYLRPSNASSFYYYQTWIEGIGSLDELLIMRAPSVDYDSDLLCFHEDDTLKYFNPVFTDCFVETTGMNEQLLSRAVTLSPNPTDGKCTISFPAHTNFAEAAAFITDISGKMILQQQLFATTNSEIDLTGLPAGLYFIRIEAKGMPALSGKVAVY